MNPFLVGILLTTLCFAQTDAERLHELQRKIGRLYQDGKYAEALPVAQSASEPAAKTLSEQNPDTEKALDQLASVYRKLDKRRSQGEQEKDF